MLGGFIAQRPLRHALLSDITALVRARMGAIPWLIL
jgi:hypothetical protein